MDKEKYSFDTYVLKSNLPSQVEICKSLGIKSPKTYKTHLNYLIQNEYIKEEDDRFVLPEKEDIYFLIPLATLQYINDNCKEHIIKIYVYLGQKYKQTQYNNKKYNRNDAYEFTLEELGEHIGIKVKNNSRAYDVLNNALTLLYNSGLIDYVSYYNGQQQKKKLIKFSFDVNKKY